MERSEEITLLLDEAVAQQARAAAAREGMSLDAWITRSIRREALASEAETIIEAEPRIRELIDRHKALGRATLQRAWGETG